MVVFAVVFVDNRRVRIAIDRLLLLSLTHHRHIIRINGAKSESFVSKLIPYGTSHATRCALWEQARQEME